MSKREEVEGASGGGPTRRQIRERLARGLYEREREKDRTDVARQSSWEELNAGRRATRLNYADEMLNTLFGAFGFDWPMADGLSECIAAARRAGRTEAADRAEEALRIIATLLPRRVGGS